MKNLSITSRIRKSRRELGFTAQTLSASMRKRIMMQRRQTRRAVMMMEEAIGEDIPG